MLLKPVGIQKRTVTVILGTALLAFLVFGLGLVLYRNSLVPARARQFLLPYADTVAVGATAAVEAGDQARALAILASLKSNPQILRADLLQPEGGTLATYPAHQPALDRSLWNRPDGIYLVADTAELVRHFSVNGPRPAHLFIRMSLAVMQQHDRQTLAELSLVVGLILGIIAWLQFLVLRRWVLSPLARLAAIAENAGRQGDYSQRMPAHDRDELGQLGGRFNSLLVAVEQREAALRQLASFQRAILNDAAYAIISTDTTGRITSLNPAAEKLLGRRADELVGQATPEIFHLPEEIAARARELSVTLGEPVPANFETLVAEARRGRHSEAEWTYVRNDGSRVPVLLSVTALRDERGEIFGFLGLATDISARRQAERHLRETLELNQRLVSASQIAINAYTADGACVLTNAAAARIIGTTVEQMSKMNFRQIASWRTSELLAAADTVLATGESRQLEVHLVTTYDREVWLDCTFSRFYSGGKPHLLHILNDITGRKHAEQSLHESRRLYEDLVSSVPLGVYRARARAEGDFCLEYVSDRFCEVTGLPREAVLADVGQVFAIIHPEDRAGFDDANAVAFQQRQSFCWEGRAIVGGQTRWLHIESRPTLLPDRLPFWTGVLYDITDRRDVAEELRQQHSLLTGTLQATADGILAVSATGRITSYNRQFVELWRVPRGNCSTRATPTRLPNMSLQQLSHPAAMQARHPPFQRHLQGGHV